MLGVTFAELWHAGRMIVVFFVLIAAALKLGGGTGEMLIDPTTLKVGSPDWAQYVRDHFGTVHM
jgi:hypothetical protein